MAKLCNLHELDMAPVDTQHLNPGAVVLCGNGQFGRLTHVRWHRRHRRGRARIDHGEWIALPARLFVVPETRL